MDYFLNSGELLFSRAPFRVRTILGSCVGVAVWDPRLKIGGLCHFLLPGSPGEPSSTRYGDVALPYLFQKFSRAGSSKSDLRTWIAGGSLLLDAQEIFFVGDRNASFAEEWLSTRGIRVVANETRGYLGRKITFDTHSGHFSSEMIPASAAKALLII